MNARPLLPEALKLSTSCFPPLDNSLGNTKRYAIYIPQSFFENARKVLAQVDDESTWEFPATVIPSKPRFSESTPDPPSTPAQEIVIRYRGGMPLYFEGDRQSDISVNEGSGIDNCSSSTFFSLIEESEPLGDTAMIGIIQTEIKPPSVQSSQRSSEELEQRASQTTPTRGFREADSVASSSPNVLQTVMNQSFQSYVHEVQEGIPIDRAPSPKSHQNAEERQNNVHRGRSFIGSSFRSIVKHLLSKLFRFK